MSFKVVAKRAVEIVAEFGPYHSFEDAKAEAQELADKMAEREDVDVYVLDPSAQDELGIGGPVAAHTHDELEHYGPELLGPQLREADNGFSRAPLRNTWKGAIADAPMDPYMISSLAARKKVFAKIDSMPDTAELMAYYHSQQDSIPKPWLHATDSKIDAQGEETFQKWVWSNHAADELAARASKAAERLGDTELAKTLQAESDRYYAKYQNMADGGIAPRHSGVVAEQGPYWPHEYVALGMTAPASPESLDWDTWHKEIKPRLKVLQNPSRWLQEADQEIEDDGTEGAFTQQARRAGYKNTMEFARKVMAGWRSGKKTVYNKKTKRQQGITQKTMYRANFAINAQKRRRNPVAPSKRHRQLDSQQREALDTVVLYARNEGRFYPDKPEAAVRKAIAQHRRDSATELAFDLETIAPIAVQEVRAAWRSKNPNRPFKVGDRVQFSQDEKWQALFELESDYGIDVRSEAFLIFKESFDEWRGIVAARGPFDRPHNQGGYLGPEFVKVVSDPGTVQMVRHEKPMFVEDWQLAAGD